MVRASPAPASDWSDSLYGVYVETPEGVRQARTLEEAYETWWGADREVGHDEVGGREVSTVFCCLRWGRDVPPLVYETLVTGLGEKRSWRYATRREAEEGHSRVVQLLRSGVRLGEIL